MLGVKVNKRLIVWNVRDRDGNELIEPLTMHINPQNIDAQYTQLINEQRTMGGFVRFFWGEDLTSMSSSGKTAMFYDNNGITIENRRTSDAYLNFISLLQIYKNNAKTYDKYSNKINSFGVIVMTYREKEYEGYFESFDYTEEAGQPFTLNYNFSFRVTRTIGDLVVRRGRFLADGRT